MSSVDHHSKRRKTRTPTASTRAAAITSLLSPQHARENKPMNAQQATAIQLRKLSTERSRLCRQRQKHYAENLEKSVAALREEVGELRAILNNQCSESTTAVSRATCARMIGDYTRLFEHGMTQETHAIGLKRALLQTQSGAETQLAFLNSIISANALVQDWFDHSHHGPQAIANQWQCWTSHHGFVRVETHTISTQGPEESPVVVTAGTMKVVISERTIQALFPHVIRNEVLVARMFGQEIYFPLRQTFQFGEDGLVQQYSSELSVLSGFTALFGSMLVAGEVVAPVNEPSYCDLAWCQPLSTATVLPVPSPCSKPLAWSPASSSSSSNSDSAKDARLGVRFLLNC